MSRGYHTPKRGVPIEQDVGSAFGRNFGSSAVKHVRVTTETAEEQIYM